MQLDVKFDHTVRCNLSQQGELTKCYHCGYMQTGQMLPFGTTKDVSKMDVDETT